MKLVNFASEQCRFYLVLLCLLLEAVSAQQKCRNGTYHEYGHGCLGCELLCNTDLTTRKACHRRCPGFYQENVPKEPEETPINTPKTPGSSTDAGTDDSWPVWQTVIGTFSVFVLLVILGSIAYKKFIKRRQTYGIAGNQDDEGREMDNLGQDNLREVIIDGVENHEVVQGDNQSEEEDGENSGNEGTDEEEANLLAGDDEDDEAAGGISGSTESVTGSGMQVTDDVQTSNESLNTVAVGAGGNRAIAKKYARPTAETSDNGTGDEAFPPEGGSVQATPDQRLDNTTATTVSGHDPTSKSAINDMSSAHPYIDERYAHMAVLRQPGQPRADGIETFDHPNLNLLLGGTPPNHTSSRSSSSSSDNSRS